MSTIDDVSVYERAGDTIYARKHRANPSTRVEVKIGSNIIAHTCEDVMWNEIQRMAKTNPSLQEAVDRVKVIYHLSKDNNGNQSKT
jgi:hypothetical protein